MNEYNGFMAIPGAKIQSIIDDQRGRAEDLLTLADEIENAWQKHDFDRLRELDVLTQREFDQIKEEMSKHVDI
jgi:hypothetical protein